MFQSDFRIVADYFVQMRTNQDYKPTKEEFCHVDEILKLMSVLTDDERFIVAQNQKEGGAKNMCEVLDKVENEGIQKGIQKGKIEAYLDMNISIEEIAQKLNLSVDQVNEIVASLDTK